MHFKILIVFIFYFITSSSFGQSKRKEDPVKITIDADTLFIDENRKVSIPVIIESLDTTQKSIMLFFGGNYHKKSNAYFLKRTKSPLNYDFTLLEKDTTVSSQYLRKQMIRLKIRYLVKYKIWLRKNMGSIDIRKTLKTSGGKDRLEIKSNEQNKFFIVINLKNKYPFKKGIIELFYSYSNENNKLLFFGDLDAPGLINRKIKIKKKDKLKKMMEDDYIYVRSNKVVVVPYPRK